MARTTAELVASVLDVEEDDVLAAYIDTANQLVSDVCTNSGYSSAKLELIERWLGAHFYAINRPRTTMESIAGGTQEQYQKMITDLFLNNSPYGQQAMVIDTAGNLAALCNRLKKVMGGSARTRWLGIDQDAI